MHVNTRYINTARGTSSVEDVLQVMFMYLIYILLIKINYISVREAGWGVREAGWKHE